MESAASCVGVPGSSAPDTAGLVSAAGTRLITASTAAVLGCFCPWTSFDIFLLLYLCLYSIFDFSRRTGWWVQNRAARVATVARVARGVVARLPCEGPSTASAVAQIAFQLVGQFLQVLQRLGLELCRGGFRPNEELLAEQDPTNKAPCLQSFFHSLFHGHSREACRSRSAFLRVSYMVLSWVFRAIVSIAWVAC